MTDLSYINRGDTQPGAELPSGFRWLGSWSNKIECVICGRTGYPVFGDAKLWTAICQRGHAPCPGCGKMLSLLRSGAPRMHARCPTPVYVEGSKLR